MTIRRTACPEVTAEMSNAYVPEGQRKIARRFTFPSGCLLRVCPVTPEPGHLFLQNVERRLAKLGN